MFFPFLKIRKYLRTIKICGKNWARDPYKAFIASKGSLDKKKKILSLTKLPRRVKFVFISNYSEGLTKLPDSIVTTRQVHKPKNWA